MPPTAADDYDSLWKGALENAFPEFIAFHFPDAHRQIDWSRGHTFLDKELQQISHDAPSGRRHVDKLARVYRHDPARRFIAKRRLVRLLYERNWRRQRILEFFGVLDWMMRLPEELEVELWHDIEAIEGERQVKYVTSVERLAIKRGIEQGLERGLERGRAEGRAALLGRQLTRRFGSLPAAITERLAHANAEQLDLWAERVLDADSLDEVFAGN